MENTAGPSVNVKSEPKFIQIKKSVPQFSGIKDTLSCNDWIKSLNAYFEGNNIVSDDDKLDVALDCIDYTKGPARKLVENIEKTTWTAFSNYMLCMTKTSDIENSVMGKYQSIFSITWNAGNQLFGEFAAELNNLFKSLPAEVKDTPDKVGTIYDILVAKVISQLPEPLKKKQSKYQGIVKNSLEWSQYVMDTHVSLLEIKKKTETIRGINQNSNSGTKSTFIDPQSSSKNEKEDKFTFDPSAIPQKPNSWEEKHNLCARCMRPGHFRYQCRSKTVLCSKCRETSHEYADHLKKKNMKKDEKSKSNESMEEKGQPSKNSK